MRMSINASPRPPTRLLQQRGQTPPYVGRGAGLRGKVSDSRREASRVSSQACRAGRAGPLPRHLHTGVNKREWLTECLESAGFLFHTVIILLPPVF